MNKLAFLLLVIPYFLFAQEPNSDIDSVIMGKVWYRGEKKPKLASGNFKMGDRKIIFNNKKYNIEIPYSEIVDIKKGYMGRFGSEWIIIEYRPNINVTPITVGFQGAVTGISTSDLWESIITIRLPTIYKNEVNASIEKQTRSAGIKLVEQIDKEQYDSAIMYLEGLYKIVKNDISQENKLLFELHHLQNTEKELSSKIENLVIKYPHNDLSYLVRGYFLSAQAAKARGSKWSDYLLPDDHIHTVSSSEIIEKISKIDIYLFQSGVINGKYINTATTWMDFKKSLKEDVHAVSKYYKRQEKLVLDINFIDDKLGVYVHVGTITFDLKEVRKYVSNDDFSEDDLYDDSLLNCCFGRMEFD